jgi:hypothetical protein
VDESGGAGDGISTAIERLGALTALLQPDWQ